uniref:Uncharacterized protein n=1 Tax=Oryza brachyantha TaxID=4533 RepID=J3LY37_ORYBR
MPQRHDTRIPRHLGRTCHGDIILEAHFGVNRMRRRGQYQPITVVVPIAGLVFLGLIAGLLLLARRRREKEEEEAVVVEDDVVHHHVRVEEHAEPGPAPGQTMNLIDITDEVDVHREQHIVRHEHEHEREE